MVSASPWMRVGAAADDTCAMGLARSAANESAVTEVPMSVVSGESS
jgi:hypothetical protein